MRTQAQLEPHRRLVAECPDRVLESWMDGQYLSHPQQIRSGCLGWIGKFVMALNPVVAVAVPDLGNRRAPNLRLQDPEPRAVTQVTVIRCGARLLK